MTENHDCDKSQIIPYYASNGSQISNQVETCELEEYTPVIDGWLFYLHTGLIIIIVCASFKIQRALYRTFKKLGSRHINSIVVPIIIIADIISPFYIIFLFLRTSYYPLKDLLGEGMCHFYDYLLVIGAFAGQFHSFYLTAFRYICLFHDDFMLRYNIRPKSLARMFLVSHFLTPTIITILLFNGSNPQRTLNACLGKFELNFVETSTDLCTLESASPILSISCWMAYILYFILSCNLAESFMLYRCFKKIEEQTNDSKEFLTIHSYIRRRKDVGIVIQISILQWVMELIQNAFYLFYMYHLRGWSHTLDKFFTLYMMAFTIIVIPLFYLNGDIDFRYDLANYGYMRALKNAISK